MIYIDTDCNAPCCPCKIVDKESGKDILVQTDFDYPGFASTFGWNLREVKPEEPSDYETEWKDNTELDETERAAFALYEKQCACDHDDTDGTIDCEHCGLDAMVFITSAGAYLEKNDGKEAEDPGYFGEG